MRRPLFLERLLAWLSHRHAWRTVGLNVSLGAPILRQECTGKGCGARRVVYDDGRSAWRVSSRLTDGWRDVLAEELERRLKAQGAPLRPPTTVSPPPVVIPPPPRSARSVAISRLEGAVSRVGSLVRGLEDDEE